MTWTTVVLIIYGAVLMGIAFLSLKYAKSIDNFLVAGRSQPKFLVVASMLASTIGGSLTIGTVTKTYGMGFPAFWFVAAGGFAHFLQAFFLSERVRKTEAMTMAEMAGKLSDDKLRFVTSLIILVTWTGIAASQFVAAAKVISTLTGIAHQPAVAIAAAFLVVYTLIGGQKSVLRTDFFQFGVLAIAIVVTLVWLFAAKAPAPGSVVVELFNAKFQPLDLVYYLVVMGGSYFICPMMFSRILSTDTPANARKSSYLSGTGMLLFAFVITFIGLWAKASLTDIGKVDPLNFMAANVLPKGIGVLVIVGVLAAILSTGDTVLITAAGVLENDLVKRKSVAWVRVWIVVVGLVAAAIALFQQDIIGMIMKTYNGYTAGLVPALFVALMLFGKRSFNGPVLVAAVVLGYGLGLGGSFATGAFWPKVLPLAGMAVSAGLALMAAYGPGSKKA